MSFANFFVGLLLAPLLSGIINRTKAFFAGRKGQPLLQAYHDLFKLLRKGAVYSKTTTWVFRAGPMAGLSSVLVALAIVPIGNVSAPLSFSGDLLLFAYLLGLMRFFTVIAALDTGSAFEGMGASREVFFSALAEPTLLVCLAAVARKTDTFSLSRMLSATSLASPEIVLITVAVFVVILCENARIPFDDPNTHLELTMIHEVMVLDHGGPDFAFVQYGASLKLWVMSALLAGIVLPSESGIFRISDEIMALCGMMLLAVLIGIVESVMSRLRLTSVPQLLVSSVVLSVFAFILVMR